MQATQLLGIALALGAPGLKDAPKKLHKIVGEWQCEKLVLCGREVAHPNNYKYVFTPDMKWIALQKGDEQSRSRYSVDSTTNPGEVDLITDSKKKGEERLLAIYKIEGNMLTICLEHGGNLRPTKFESERRYANHTVRLEEDRQGVA